MSKRLASGIGRAISEFVVRGSVVLALVVTGLLAQQAPTDRSGLLFGARTDVVRLDVTVLDKSRRPVRDLTAADFTVFENGRERPVVAFSAVDLPPAAAADRPAAWTRDAPRDVVSNTTSSDGRLVVIAFDWSIRNRDVVPARRIARAIVDGLGPSDMAAVVFTRPSSGAGQPQNFTSDRALLRAAIERPFGVAETQRPPQENLLEDPEGYHSGDCHCRTCSMESLTHVATQLRFAADRPKAIFLITTYVRPIEPPVPVRKPPPVPGVMQPAWYELPGACTVPLDDARKGLDRAAARANVSLHVLDTVGLETAETTPLGARRIAERQAALPVVAEMTGGRAVLNTNAPETQVPSILDETSTYYIVGFTPAAAEGDTRAHRVEIKTRRRDVTVHAQDSFTRSETPVPTVTPDDVSMLRAVGGLLPSRDIPFEASVVPVVTDPGRSSSAVIVARLLDSAALTQPTAAAVTVRKGLPTVNMLAAAFTPFSTSVTSKRRVVELRPSPTPSGVMANHGILSELPIEPGRYQVRIAAELSSGTAGSVHTFVEVPDFKRAPLSMSGVLVHVEPPDPIEPADEISRLPVVPTARRQFRRSESVSAVVQVIQGTERQNPLQPVRFRARITDARDNDVRSETDIMAPDRFTHRMAIRTLQLPVQNLTAGAYLLRVTATMGERTIERAVRFEVR